MLRTIFRKAQNKIQDPAKLKRLIADLIDKRRGPRWMPISRAISTKGCCRRTRKTLSRVRDSTLLHVR